MKDIQSIQGLAAQIEAKRIELNKTSGFEKLYHKVLKLYFGGMAKHLMDLKPYLNNLEELEKVMREWIFKKPKEHHFEEEHSSTVMNEIGG